MLSIFSAVLSIQGNRHSILNVISNWSTFIEITEHLTEGVIVSIALTINDNHRINQTQYII